MTARRWLVLVAALPLSASAAGFAVSEQSAKATASSGAGTASVEGAAAIYYNAGNVAFEDGISAELGTTLIAPSFSYEPLRAVDGRPSSVEPSLFALPTLFAAAPVSDSVFVGFGAFANFGLGLKWPDDFDGRFESSAANITTFTLNPTVAWRIDRNWGVGAGVDVVRSTVELAQKLYLVDAEGSLRMGGGTYGVGVNAGVGGRLLGDKLSAGLSWRSAVRLRFSGRADFQVPKEFESTLRDQDVATQLTLPHVFSLGAAYRLVGNARLIGEVGYTMWSSFDAIRIDFAESDDLDQELRRDWKDTVSVRVGGEVEVMGRLTLRAGAGWDPTPSPSDTVSPSLPDSDRLLLSAGAGYRFGNLTADLGYLFVLVMPRETTGEAFPARYSGAAHVLGLSVAFRQ